MVRRFVLPFLLSSLILGLAAALMGSLGPITLLIVFAGGALGAAAVAVWPDLRLGLDRVIWPGLCVGVGLGAGSITTGREWLVWLLGALAVILWSALQTRLLQTAERGSDWLLAIAAGFVCGPLAAHLARPVSIAPSTIGGVTVAELLWRPDIAQTASLFPTALLGLAALVAVVHMTLSSRRAGPLLSGAFLTGLGSAGLLVMAIEIVKSESVLPIYGAAFFMGVWRARHRDPATHAPSLTPVLIRAVLTAILAYYLLQNFSVPSAALAALPVFWSAQAWALQMFLMKPGGERAIAQLQAVHLSGLALGVVVVKVASWMLGPMAAAAVSAGFYLLAALVFSEERFWPSAKNLLSQPG